MHSSGSRWMAKKGHIVFFFHFLHYFGTTNSNAVCTVYDCVRVNYNGSEIYRFDSIGRLFAAEYQLFCRQLLAALKLLFECL